MRFAAAAGGGAGGKPPTVADCAKTVIGWGAPNKQGSASMHGEAHGATRKSAATRLHLGWTSPPFGYRPTSRAWDLREKGVRVEGDGGPGSQRQNEFPHWRAELEQDGRADLPGDFGDLINAYIARPQSDESRSPASSSQPTLNSIRSRAARTVLLLIPPTLRRRTARCARIRGPLTPRLGRQLPAFRVRELHAAIWKRSSRRTVVSSPTPALPDLFGTPAMPSGCGADAPAPFSSTLTTPRLAKTAQRTSQRSCVHLALIPHMDLWLPFRRGRDATAWDAAIEIATGPPALTSRGSRWRTKPAIQVDRGIKRGGYVLIDSDVRRKVIVIATGSEVGNRGRCSPHRAAKGKRSACFHPSSTTSSDRTMRTRQSYYPRRDAPRRG